MAALESDEEAFYSLDSLSDAGEETAESRKELAEATPVKAEDEKETNPIDKEEELDEEEAEERKREAEAKKAKGNESFGLGDFEEAIEAYSEAIRLCPSRWKELVAVYYANRAAAKIKLEKADEAIEDCTKALDLNPRYLKVRLRRAQAYESVDKLEEAFNDYQTVVEQDPSNSQARGACMRLPPQIEEQREKMKAEMMGKLKDLGNMVLRPFGLSTDNFQFNQDPNSGGYNISFKKS